MINAAESILFRNEMKETCIDDENILDSIDSSHEMIAVQDR